MKPIWTYPLTWSAVVVVGSATLGKGLVQTIAPLPGFMSNAPVHRELLDASVMQATRSTILLPRTWSWM